MRNYPFTLLFCFIFMLILSSAAYADSGESSGSIHIDVIDAKTQRQIAGASFSVSAADSLLPQNAQPPHSSAHSMTLPPGLYQVQVFHPQYQTVIAPSVRIVKGKTTSLSLSMIAARSDTETLVVYGDQSRLDSLTSAGARYFDRESLRSNAGSGSDILRALDGLPGLFSSGEFASYTVRGNGPRDNLILVDGFPFANIVHFDDSFGELEDIEGGGRYSVFAPNLINGATFQPGGWSAAYGGRAGSLLLLDVAKGNSQTASYSARLDLAGIELGYDGPSNIHADTSLLFSARTQDFGRFFETIGLDDIGSPKNTDIIVKTSSRLDQNNDLELLFIYAPEKFLRDIDNVLASDEDEPGNYTDIELEKSETENYLLGATWTAHTDSNARWTHRLYYRYFEQTASSGEAYPDLVPIDTPAQQIPVRDNIISSSRQEQEIGLRSDFTQWNRFGEFNAGLRIAQTRLKFDINLAADWQQFEYDSDDFRADANQHFIVLTPNDVNNRLHDSNNLYSVYTDQTFDLANWQLRTGIRLDHDSLADENILSPRFSASRRATDNTKLVLTAGRYNNAPRFNDRAAAAENRRLKHELTDQISLGLSYLFRPDLELLVEPYYQHQTKLIVEADRTNRSRENSGTGRSWGVDTALIKRFSHGWSASANYSYNQAKVQDAADLPYYAADFHRPHSFSLGGVWEINERWKLSSRWKWASGTPADGYVIYANVLGEGHPLRFAKENISNNSGRYQNFHSLNVRLDYRRTFNPLSVIVFLDVINLYGADNPLSSEFNPRSGENNIEEGQVLPILGVRLEW
ncbi:TonB-dependent receptor plug domain-containing protein [Rheinheimera muenzenbergensis]|uniref:TonB-dependent receptor plug domain-containing protein n=1 Tax=Rheinheimera muenzenbergensis TaxID=1193628 RepID=A0ABU8C627_9GAMM